MTCALHKPAVWLAALALALACALALPCAAFADEAQDVDPVVQAQGEAAGELEDAVDEGDELQIDPEAGAIVEVAGDEPATELADEPVAVEPPADEGDSESDLALEAASEAAPLLEANVLDSTTGSHRIAVSGLGDDVAQLRFLASCGSVGPVELTGVLHADGTWSADVTASALSFAQGLCVTSVFAVAADGSEELLGTVERQLARPTALVTAQLADQQRTCSIKATNVGAGLSGEVRSVLFGVWSDLDGRDDMVWLTGKKNAQDGSWTFSDCLAGIVGSGVVHIECHAVVDGRQVLVGTTAFLLEGPSANVTYKVDSYKGTVTITLTDVMVPRAVSSIYVTTKVNGNGPVVFQAKKAADGTWTAVVDPQEFWWELGSYESLVYVVNSAGAATQLKTVRTTLSNVPQSALNYLNSKANRAIDVSKWNGTINWQAVSSQVAFAVIRLTDDAASNRGNLDPTLLEYAAGCRANGIPFGVYIYFRSSTASGGAAEAANALARIREAGIYPTFVALDCEEQSVTITSAAVEAAVSVLRGGGVKKVGIYTSLAYYDSLVSSSFDFVWVPRYGSNTGTVQWDKQPWRPFDIWQFTSQGSISGVPGSVDVNYINTKGPNSRPVSYYQTR